MDCNSLSFDGMVTLYEETRNWNEDCFCAALDYLEARFPPEMFTKVFEPGVGSGRIAFPLAYRGYDVTGVDISSQMLNLLHNRMLEKPSNIAFRIADVTKLPFADAEFDMSIAVHLFYFIKDWKTAVEEQIRVVKHEGPMILMHTGSGMEVPELNKRYKELCKDLGVTINSIGVNSTSEVVKYLQETGRSVEIIRDRWIWTSQIQINQALQYIKHRAYSFTTVAPDSTHLEAVAKLEKELMESYGNLNTVIKVPNQISLVIAFNRDRIAV